MLHLSISYNLSYKVTFKIVTRNSNIEWLLVYRIKSKQMKIAPTTLLGFLTLIVSLILSGFIQGAVLGQSDSTSSSGSSQVILDPGFTGIWESIPTKTVTINGIQVRGSSKTFRLRLCVENGQLKGTISHPHILGLGRLSIVSQTTNFPNQVQLELEDKFERNTSLTLVLENGQLKGSFPHNINFEAVILNEFNPSGACKLKTNSSSSSSGGIIVLNQEFSGTWESKPRKSVIIDGVQLPGYLNKIVMKLCVKDGQLNGTFSSNGILQESKIISQTVTSQNNIELQLQDSLGTTDSLTLVLDGGKLQGTFSDGTSFIAKKHEPVGSKRDCPLKGLDTPSDPIFD